MSIEQPKTDEEYQARSDAHTLKDATAIHGDPKRLKKAQTALEQIEKEAQEALDAIQSAKRHNRQNVSEHEEGYG